MSMLLYSYSGNGVPDSTAPGPGTHSLEELFQCMWGYPHGTYCNALIRGYNLATHLREVHGIHGPDKLRLECKWNGCDRELNKESLVRHVEECHIGIVFDCKCGKTFSRKDTLGRHKKTCSEEEY
ncbi:hypothetical protein EDB19DRAFT_1024344 [Suillus lakei]|nr:hypothetical protein EDB19DRAFT_1024344 [Suillus lakei]